MPVYTVHRPVLPIADALSDAESVTFVRDGFSLWAFLFAPWWMLWHRMWLVLVGYVVVSAALFTAMVVIGASSSAVVLVELLVALLIGLEAGTLRRFSLSRRGWKNVGIVSGADREDAERRFFDTRPQQTSVPRGASSTPASSAPGTPPPPVQRMPQPPAVVGLFPEPGAQR